MTVPEPEWQISVSSWEGKALSVLNLLPLQRGHPRPGGLCEGGGNGAVICQRLRRVKDPSLPLPEEIN